MSIVIVTYNGARWLPGCLSALAAQTFRDFEIVIVDNASTDESTAIAARSCPSAILLPQPRNLGFAAATNVGVAASRGRFVALLNADTEAEPGWLAALRRGLDAHPWSRLATSRVVYLHDPHVIDSAGDGVTTSGGAYKRLHGRPASAGDDVAEVFGVSGAACLVPREIFDELGGLDADFFASHEDVDFSYRAQLRGYRVVYVPDAIVHHAGSASMGHMSARQVFYGQRNLEWVYLKNTPASLLLRTLPAHGLYVCASAVHFASVGRLVPFLSAKWAALRGAPAMWRKRRGVQRTRRSDIGRMARLMERHWMALKWREKAFDRRVARRA